MPIAFQQTSLLASLLESCADATLDSSQVVKGARTFDHMQQKPQVEALLIVGVHSVDTTQGCTFPEIKPNVLKKCV